MSEKGPPLAGVGKDIFNIKKKLVVSLILKYMLFKVVYIKKICLLRLKLWKWFKITLKKLIEMF
jgi:hypothetical protein